MGINCTDFCLYQIDGNCTLKDINKNKLKTKEKIKSDCPYFISELN